MRFDSGLRFRRPQEEFGIEAKVAPLPIYQAAAPMALEQRDARHLVESLRVGIAPIHYIHELTIGLEREQQSVKHALNEAKLYGGSARVVLGDYGQGKSHMVELSAQHALKENFLVATISLDLLELPPHRPFELYGEFLRQLRYPDSEDKGLEYLLEQAEGFYSKLKAASDPSLEAFDPLLLSSQVFEKIASQRQRKAWTMWLSGGKKGKLMSLSLKQAGLRLKIPTIYKLGYNSRQLSYLLSGLSVLAKLCGYSGLALLIDEAESYALLSRQQKPKASVFFASLLAATLGKRSKIEESGLPQHHLQDYPLRYREGQSLCFIFTSTHSDQNMPIHDWLGEEAILELDSHPSPQEIGQFLEHVQHYHAQAYGYEAGERQGQVRRAGAELLAMGVRHDLLGMRGLVRLSVELYDLLYLYPDYEVAGL
ncbi:MAG: DUF2791 family P-loop domain-containing protein [Deinococcales bacterium]